MLKEKNDRYSDLREKINLLLKDRKLVCIELNIVDSLKNKNVEVFLAKRNEEGTLVSPMLDELEEICDMLDLFFEKELSRNDFSISLSSPGSDRKLKSKEDFSLFCHRTCKLTYTDDKEKVYTAVAEIQEAEKEAVKLKLQVLNDKECFDEISVLFDNIKKACLV